MVGCLLFKLCFQKTPFEDAAGNVERMGIINAKYSIPAQHQFSERLISLIHLCLNRDPSSRPSAKQVLDMAENLLSSETFDWGRGSRDNSISRGSPLSDFSDREGLQPAYIDGSMKIVNNIRHKQSTT